MMTTVIITTAVWGCVLAAKIITGGNGWRTFTYWMPLPEPPKEEKE